jgi:hypothetical protein
LERSGVCGLILLVKDFKVKASRWLQDDWLLADGNVSSAIEVPAVGYAGRTFMPEKLDCHKRFRLSPSEEAKVLPFKQHSYTFGALCTTADQL